jgi:hypothetical protein
VNGQREEIVAVVVLKPASGRTITGAPDITAETLHEFAPDPGDVDAVSRTLTLAGFRVGPMVGVGMSVAGPRTAFEAYFRVQVREAEEGGWVAGAGGPRELPVPAELADRVHAVTFEPPAEAVTGP